MNPVIEKIVQPVVDGSVNLATASVKRSRKLAETSSDWVAKSTKDVAKASNKGLKLNKISHDMLARLLNEQSRLVQGSLRGVAKRLDVAANADSFQMLWSDQVDLMPKTRERLTRDTRNVIAVFTDTGAELRDWVVDIAGEFGKESEKAVKRTRKTATKLARQPGKKVSRSKKTAKKKATKAGKTVRKTAKKRTRKVA
ncbi:MAG: hypothetical protein HKN70_09480 [Gammaproteobacteria bacterium]|nr:hypothetical protein [Gammaproteobacteria bacterium]